MHSFCCGHWGGRPARSGSDLYRELRQKRTHWQSPALLASGDPHGPNTIGFRRLQGNFVIQSMDRLTLITKNGASITDRSGGTLAVVDIEDSQQRNPAGIHHQRRGAGNPMQYRKSLLPDWQHDSGSWRFWCKCIKGSRAFLKSNVIQNWVAVHSLSSGAQVFSSNDVFQSNGGSALVVLRWGLLRSLDSRFDNNGVGIDAGRPDTRGGTISGNSSDGIRLLSGKAVFLGPTITANGGVGVHLEDGAFAGFLAASITGKLSGWM